MMEKAHDSTGVKTFLVLETDQGIDRKKVDADSQISSKENTPSGQVVKNVEKSDEGEEYEQDREDSESNGDDSGNDDESSESEDDVEVQRDKTPFALLKSLYGIMNISKFGIKTNKVGILEEKVQTSEPAETKIGASGHISSGDIKKDTKVG